MSEEGTTILVEDNEDHAMLAQWALKGGPDPRAVVWLRDGEEALRYLAESSSAPGSHRGLPGLILLDINLPKVGGKEVLRRLRACDGLRAIPVVMLTTSDSQDDVDECYALGCNSYVVKPVGFEDLSRKLKAIQLYWNNTSRADARPQDG